MLEAPRSIRGASAFAGNHVGIRLIEFTRTDALSLGAESMIEGPLVLVAAIAAVGCGLMAGSFYVFSAFVMRALRRLPAPAGIEAMQSINERAVTPTFMLGLFGTAVACAAAALLAITDWTGAASGSIVAAAASYLAGVLAMTAGYHVPRNNRLASMDPGSHDAKAYWARYVREWTRWNHLRALAASVALVGFIVGLRIGSAA